MPGTLTDETPVIALWPRGEPGRTFNRLLRADLRTIGALTACTAGDLLGLRDFGPGMLAEVRQALRNFGLALKGEDPADLDPAEVDALAEIFLSLPEGAQTSAADMARAILHAGYKRGRAGTDGQ